MSAPHITETKVKVHHQTVYTSVVMFGCTHINILNPVIIFYISECHLLLVYTMVVMFGCTHIVF